MDNISQIIFAVTNEMHLDQDATQKLKDILYIQLNKYDVLSKTANEIMVNPDFNYKVVNWFLSVKAGEGFSVNTIRLYEYELRALLGYLNKDLRHISPNDIRAYLAHQRENRGNTSTTINNKLACYKSLFSWLYLEGFIPKDPVANVNMSKVEKRIRKPFSDTELEKLMQQAKTLRDKTIIQTLLSTGCRVAELVSINIEDLDFDNRSVTVFGKGAKEREVFLNEIAIYYLRQYLETRTDDIPALFISSRKQRFSIRGIETMLRTLGATAGVKNVHPHRFRRTMATNLLNKGMGMEGVRVILGHENMNTTLRYAIVSTNNVKADFYKYS